MLVAFATVALSAAFSLYSIALHKYKSIQQQFIASVQNQPQEIKNVIALHVIQNKLNELREGVKLGRFIVGYPDNCIPIAVSLDQLPSSDQTKASIATNGPDTYKIATINNQDAERILYVSELTKSQYTTTNIASLPLQPRGHYKDLNFLNNNILFAIADDKLYKFIITQKSIIQQQILDHVDTFAPIPKLPLGVMLLSNSTRPYVVNLCTGRFKQLKSLSFENKFTELVPCSSNTEIRFNFKALRSYILPKKEFLEKYSDFSPYLDHTFTHMHICTVYTTHILHYLDNSHPDQTLKAYIDENYTPLAVYKVPSLINS